LILIEVINQRYFCWNCGFKFLLIYLESLNCRILKLCDYSENFVMQFLRILNDLLASAEILNSLKLHRF
jgi:hypothetical protein